MAAFLLLSVNFLGCYIQENASGFCNFVICLAVLYKIICIQFFICIILCVLLFYAFVTRESQSVLCNV